MSPDDHSAEEFPYEGTPEELREVEAEMIENAEARRRLFEEWFLLRAHRNRIRELMARNHPPEAA